MTFLSHGRQAEVICFPLQLVFSLPFIYRFLFTSRADWFENLGEITVSVREMFTSGFRPWLKNVTCLKSSQMWTLVSPKVSARCKRCDLFFFFVFFFIFLFERYAARASFSCFQTTNEPVPSKRLVYLLLFFHSSAQI